jgi:sulfite exporter TauE/SafE
MLSTETIYFVLFTTGLTVGFGHCIGMCGPIVVSLSLSLKGRSVVVPHLLYNGGRITTYGTCFTMVDGSPPMAYSEVLWEPPVPLPG